MSHLHDFRAKKPHFSAVFGAVASALVTAVLVTACRPPAPPPPRPTEAEIATREANSQRKANKTSTDSKHAKRTDGLQGGTLLVSDDFDTPLGNRWSVKLPGEWTATNGELVAKRVNVYDDRNKGVWLNTKLPAKVRIEFESRSLGKDGDTKCEIFATEQTHEAGYSLIFGGWTNTINTICRLGEHEPKRVVQVPHQRVERAKRYKWTIVRNDNAVRWYIDGKFMIAYDDVSPVKGQWFGFNNWLSDIRFDNFKVWRL